MLRGVGRGLLLSAAAFVLAACGGGGGERLPPPASPLASPIELGYQLVPAIQTATFAGMLGVSVVPGQDGQVVVLTQDGKIWRVPIDDDARSEPVLYADLSDRLIDGFAQEEGLLGLAFSPQFEEDRRVFVHYTGKEPPRNVISWFPAEDGVLDLSAEHVILETPKTNRIHNGGQLAFGPDGYLYIALGDGNPRDMWGHAQALHTLKGSILRIDVSGEGYEVPPDNPFVDTPGARPEIYAYGFRNPWRMSFDRETGELWTGDVGATKWEEIDRVIAGGNYGWKILEGFECFEEPDCVTDGLVPPRLVYAHSRKAAAVIGGYVYRGSAMPELFGWYIYGDFVTGQIWAFDTAVELPPVLLAETGLPISTFAELPNGELLAATFAEAIYRLEQT